MRTNIRNLYLQIDHKKIFVGVINKWIINYLCVKIVFKINMHIFLLKSYLLNRARLRLKEHIFVKGHVLSKELHWYLYKLILTSSICKFRFSNFVFRFSCAPLSTSWEANGIQEPTLEEGKVSNFNLEKISLWNEWVGLA